MSVRKVRQQGGFLELVGAAGSDEAGPVLEFGLPGRRLLRQVERPHLLAHDFGVEERFGFDGHGDLRITICDLRAPCQKGGRGKSGRGVSGREREAW